MMQRIIFLTFSLVLLLAFGLQAQSADEMIKDADALANSGEFTKALEAYVLIPDAVNLTPANSAHITTQTDFCKDMQSGITAMQDCIYGHALPYFQKYAATQPLAAKYVTDMNTLTQAKALFDRCKFAESKQSLTNLSVHNLRNQCADRLAGNCDELLQAIDFYQQDKLQAAQQIFGKYFDNASENACASEYYQKCQTLQEVNALMKNCDCRAAEQKFKQLNKWPSDNIIEAHGKEVQECAKARDKAKMDEQKGDRLFEGGQYEEALTTYDAYIITYETSTCLGGNIENVKGKMADCKKLVKAGQDLALEQTKGCAADYTACKTVYQSFKPIGHDPAIKKLADIKSLEDNNKTGMDLVAQGNTAFDVGNYLGADNFYAQARKFCPNDIESLTEKQNDCNSLITAESYHNAGAYDKSLGIFNKFAQKQHAPSSYYLAWALVKYRKERDLARAETLMNYANSKKYYAPGTDISKFRKTLADLRKETGFNVGLVVGISLPVAWKINYEDTTGAITPVFDPSKAIDQLPGWFLGARFDYMLKPYLGFSSEFRIKKNGFTATNAQATAASKYSWISMDIPFYAVVNNLPFIKYDKSKIGAYKSYKFSLGVGFILTKPFSITQVDADNSLLSGMFKGASVGFCSKISAEIGSIKGIFASVGLEYFTYGKMIKPGWQSGTYNTSKALHSLALSLSFRIW